MTTTFAKHWLVPVLALFLLASCLHDEEDALPPPPDDPEGTDYSDPGSHGRVGVKLNDEAEVETVEVEEFNLQGGVVGGKTTDQRYWDQEHEFDKCPESDFYVYANASEELAVAQCQDGEGYGNVCEAAKAVAWRRAQNVIRSCKRAPSCVANVVDTGQRWHCSGVRDFLGENPDGTPIWSPPYWERYCWVQYRVSCFET